MSFRPVPGITPVFARALALVLFVASLAASAQPLVFDPASPPVSPTPPAEAYAEYTGPFSHEKGPKTLLVVLVAPNDFPTWSNPPSFATLDAQLNSTSSSYYNASYRQTWFGPKVRNVGQPNQVTVPRLVVTPVLPLPDPSSFYMNNLAGMYDACLTALAKLGGDFAPGGQHHHENFDRIVIMSNTKLVTSTGLAFVGGRFSWTANSIGGGVAEHELGHNWGTSHANLWYGSNGEPRGPAGTHTEYGDGSDVMGGGSTLFNARFRTDLGFLEDSRDEVLTVPASGTYRLFNFVDPHSKNLASRLRALRIPITGTSDWDGDKYLLLGFRHTAGTDGAVGRNDWERNAVQVNAARPSPEPGDNTGSHFIDTSLGSIAGGGTLDRVDGALKIGRTWSEGANVNGANIRGGFHITPVARGNVTVNGNTHEYIDVRVNYADEITGNRAPSAPTITSTAASSLLGSTTLYQAAVGSPVPLAATAADPDGDTLAYDWHFGFTGAGSYSITNSPSQSPAFSAPGLYLVTVTVSDMKGGRAMGYAWVDVAAPAAADATAVAAPLSGLSYAYYEGAFTAQPDLSRLLPVRTGVATSIDVSPAERSDNFALLFTGFITAPDDDAYQFRLTAEDGARLFINDALVVDNSSLKSARAEMLGGVLLKAGRHRIRVEYYHRDGSEALSLSWFRLGAPASLVPGSAYSRADLSANPPPTVSITAPSAGAEIVAGGSAVLQATASDATGIERIQFFSGGAFLGETIASANATTLDASYVWTALTPGARTIVARAIDRAGLSTLAAPLSFVVVNPPPANTISLNFRVAASPDLARQERAGAYQSVPNWNNLVGNTAALSALVDHTGTATTAAASVNFLHQNGYVTTTATPSDGNSRMMRGGVWSRSDAASSRLTVTGVPYVQYDVYVYFDAAASDAADSSLGAYTLNGVTRYGRNSRSSSDAVGDFPNYDTWVGFKEATAATTAAPEDQQLGNYLVFRNQTSPSLILDVQRQRPLNGLQIVEVPATIPRLILTETAGGTVVGEDGSQDSYAIRLSTAPAAAVTVSISPASGLQVAPSSLTFTPENWRAPQTVSVRALDNAAPEGARNLAIAHSVTGPAPYSGLSSNVSVSVTDNDQPAVSVYPVGGLGEGGSTSGSFRLVRAGQASLAQPLVVSVQLSGTTDRSGDYTLSGGGVAYDPSGAGSVTIPAGAAEVLVSGSAIDDTVDEGLETITLTVQPASAYLVGASASASIDLADNDRAIVYLENYNGERVFDLVGRRITFTPDGSPAFYRATQGNFTAAELVPAGSLVMLGNNGSTNPDRDANSTDFWTWALPANVSYYGYTYDSLSISYNGYVEFFRPGESASSNPNIHDTRRVRAYQSFLRPYVSNGGGIFAGRVEGARPRFVVLYNNVLVGISGRVTTQVEFFDDGSLSIAWTNITPASGIWVGLTNKLGTPDGFQEYDFSRLAILPPDQAPAFATVPLLDATVGSPYSYAAVAIDPEGAALAITAPVSPSWLTLTPGPDGTATLAGTPTAPGLYAVTLQVDDGALGAQQTFTLNVSSAVTNTAPVFTSSPVLFADAGLPYLGSLSATDAEGAALVFSGVNLPGWLSVAPGAPGTATLSGTPPENLQPTEITVAVSDGFLATFQSFLLTVNSSPRVDITRPAAPGARVAAGQTIALAAQAADDSRPAPAALTHQWSRISGPAPVVFSSPGALETLATFSQAGVYELRFTSSDGVLSSSVDRTVVVGTATDTLLATNLQAFWRADEGSGLTLADSSTNNRTLTLPSSNNVLVTSLSWIGGYSGRAISSTGSGAVAGSAMTDAPATTVTCWTTITALPATAERTLWSFTNNANLRHRAFVPNGSRRLRIASQRTGSGAAGGVWECATELPGNDWFHLAVAYDRSSNANNPVVVINGVPQPVARITAPAGNAFTDTNGFRLVPSWAGAVDEIRVYSRALSTAEMRLATLVSPANSAPVVELPSSLSTILGLPTTLEAAVSDDALPASPGQISATWSQVSGPASAAFVDPAVLSPLVSFPSGGDYVLRLAATDGELITTRDIAITVKAPPPPPGQFRATATTTTSIQLAWQDLAGDETAYVVERRLASAATFGVVASLPPDSTGHTDTGLQPATAYVYRLRVTNEAGATTGAELSVSTASPSGYSTWADARGAGFSGATANHAADPDSDGLANLLEYALGANPLGADTRPAPSTRLDASGRLTISFSCPSDRTDLRYIVQSSANLASWTDIAMSEGGGAFTPVSTGSALVSDPGGSGAREVSVALPNDTSPRRFLRLQVSLR